jgi:hypothetical protein
VPALIRILVVIPLAYVAACIAAGASIVVALYDFGGDPDFVMEGFAAGAAIVIAAFAGAYAALPMLVAIAFAEILGWRSFFFWAPLGGAVGLAIGVLHQVGLPDQATTMLCAAAGVVAGAVYWVIAGRRSGVAVRSPAVSPERVVRR